MQFMLFGISGQTRKRKGEEILLDYSPSETYEPKFLHPAITNDRKLINTALEK